MMLVEDADAGRVTRDEIGQIAATFGGDANLLTPALRLRVRQLSGAPLTVEEAMLLPERDWRSFAYREGLSRLDDRQEPLSALALIMHRHIAEPDEATEWELPALDA